MALYELRTYTIVVGKMNAVVELYHQEGWLEAQTSHSIISRA